MSEELYRLGLAEAVSLLGRKEISPLELVDASADRITDVDGDLNAVPTTCFNRARDHAKAIMDGKAPGGLLGGVPFGIKDLQPAEGPARRGDFYRELRSTRNFQQWKSITRKKLNLSPSEADAYTTRAELFKALLDSSPFTGSPPFR